MTYCWFGQSDTSWLCKDHVVKCDLITTVG